MYMLRLSYLMVIVPIAVLFTASFFVLFTLRKIEEKWLKVFGYVVVGLLWLAALVVLLGAAYNMKGSSIEMKRAMMKQKMKAYGSQQMMQQHKMPDMAMPGKGAPVRDEKLSKSPKCGSNKGVIFKAE